MKSKSTQSARRPEATTSCSACRAVVAATQNFCGRCGSPLRALDNEVPEYLQERVRNARAALEADHKLVTILFADIVGSTELIRDLDPEQAGAIFDPVLQQMATAIHRHGGVVTRIQGDGIMALFGAPVAQEDHAVSACRAALDIRALADPRVKTRIGINSGEVALRVIRNAGFVEYDAVGVSVHMAARMEQTTQPETIRVTAATRRLLQPQFVVRSLGLVSIKGASGDSMEAFEVIGEAGSTGRRLTSRIHDRGPFINRSTEFASVKAAAAAAELGHCQVVAISGQAGIGKSRLVDEIAAYLETAGWLILATSAAGEERGASYAPFVQVLCDCLGTDLDGQHEPVTQQLARALAAIRPAFSTLLAPLLALLGANVEDLTWDILTPDARRRRIIEAVTAIIRHVAAKRKLLLVVENLHWLDRESEVLLDHLIKELSGLSAVIAVTFRPGYQERWRRTAGYRRHNIEALSEIDCRRLVDAMLGTHPSLSAVKTQLVARTQGVPLFLEEMVKTLSETAVVDGEVGNFRAGNAVVELKIPDSVRPVLAARIDRLPSAAKEILQVAAAIGGEFDVSLLAGAHGCSVAELAPHLDVLETGDFIVVQKGKPADRFAFRHVLIQEATYRSLLSTKRWRIHAAIANAMEQLYPQRLEQEAEALARHFLEGQLWDHAVTHLKEAARKAIDQAARSRAIHFIEQALDALRNLPDQSRQTIEREIELRLLLRESLGSLGQYDRWLENVDAAERLAVELDDHARILAIRIARLHLHNIRADIRRAIIVCQEAEEMARAQGNAGHIVAAAYFLSQARNWRGECQAAISCLHAALPALQDLPRDARCGMTGTASVMYHAQLAPSHAWLGEFSKALEHGRTALRLADETRREFDRAVAGFGYGTALFVKGSFGRAVEVLEKALAATERAEIPLLFEALAGPLSYALLRKGDTARALLLTEQLLARPEVFVYSRSWTLLYRSLVCMETGQAEATTLAQEALRRAQKNGYQLVEAMSHLVLCRFQRAADIALARQHLASASAMAGELHLAPLEAHCLTEAAHIAVAVRSTEAAAAIVAANRTYRRLGMRFQVTTDTSVQDLANPQGATTPTLAGRKGDHHVD